MKKLFLILIGLFICITLQSQTSARFIDNRDGQVYKAVKIGDQWWMAENLNYDTTGGYCYSDDCGTYAGTYGRLYVWNTAMGGSEIEGSRGICPEGWHIPTDAEWTTLTTFLGGTTVAGGKLKATGTTYWDNENIGATNESGFSALPGGLLYTPPDNFDGMRTYAFFWSSTRVDAWNAKSIRLNDTDGDATHSESMRESGLSLRCLKNEPFDFSMLYDDFETGAVSTDWDGGNSQTGGYRTVVGDAAKNGDYGLDIGMDGSVSGYGYSYLYYYYTDNPQPEIWVRYWFKLVDATLLTNVNDYDHGYHCETFNKDDYEEADFIINMYASGGNVYWHPYFGGTSMGDPLQINLNQWYEVKYRVKLDGSNDTAQIWVDKSSEWFLTGAYGNDSEGFTETMVGYYPNGPSQYNECVIYVDNFGVYISDPGDFGSGSTLVPHISNFRLLENGDSIMGLIKFYD